jgi:hypothetical protein
LTLKFAWLCRCATLNPSANLTDLQKIIVSTF